MFVVVFNFSRVSILKQAPRLSVKNVAGLYFKKCAFQMLIIFIVFMSMSNSTVLPNLI